MSALQVSRWTTPAWRRSAGDDALFVGPLMLGVAATGWRLAGAPLAAAFTLTGLIAALALVVARTRRFDRAWAVRRLDALRPDLEDSADLLFEERMLSRCRGFNV